MNGCAYCGGEPLTNGGFNHRGGCVAMYGSPAAVCDPNILQLENRIRALEAALGDARAQQERMKGSPVIANPKIGTGIWKRYPKPVANAAYWLTADGRDDIALELTKWYLAEGGNHG